MSKESSENQAKRRQRIIDYIKDKDYLVRSGEICTALGTSRSSLSDDINAINAQEYIIESPKRGYYKIVEKESESITVQEVISKKHVRRWLILALLSSDAQSFENLHETLNDTWGNCNKNTLYNDLQELLAQGLIWKKKIERRFFYGSDAIYFSDKKELLTYLKERKKETDSSRMNIKAYEAIDAMLQPIFAEIGLNQNSSRNIYRGGKYNIISDKQLHLLNHFCTFPYTQNVLELEYKSNRGDILNCFLSVGMIVYSIETNRIYLFGKDQKKRFSIIPLDQIVPDSIKVCSKKYNYCNPTEFYQIYEEMLNISVEEPVNVRVRFQNISSVREKVERLHHSRKLSTIKLINDNKEILYTDTLRGLADFARFLRRFGRSVIVDEPQQLREKMISTSLNVQALYAEDFLDEFE